MVLDLLQTTSDFSETSSVSDMKHLVEDKDEDKQTSGIPMTSFNFINSIVGSGIIGQSSYRSSSIFWDPHLLCIPQSFLLFHILQQLENSPCKLFFMSILFDFYLVDVLSSNFIGCKPSLSPCSCLSLSLLTPINVFRFIWCTLKAYLHLQQLDFKLLYNLKTSPLLCSLKFWIVWFILVWVVWSAQIPILNRLIFFWLGHKQTWPSTGTAC